MNRIFIGAGLEALESYILDVGLRDTPTQKRCREETARHSDALYQIGADQGAVMALLVKLIGARRCLEMGTFTGYSAMVVAQALPDDGRLITMDVSEEYTDIARGYWRDAGVADKIELRLGPAVETLDRMIAAGEGPFDFAFIDADKPNYDNYYERSLTLLRQGGLIVVDNMIWKGDVADPSKTDERTAAIRALNQKVHDDARVDMALAAIGDGMLLVRKR